MTTQIKNHWSKRKFRFVWRKDAAHVELKGQWLNKWAYISIKRELHPVYAN